MKNNFNKKMKTRLFLFALLSLSVRDIHSAATPVIEDDSEETAPAISITSPKKENKKADKQLLEAARIGNLELIKKALKNGANINAKTDRKCTSLHFAACGGYIEVVKFLIKSHIDIHAKADDNVTPLNLAAEGGHLEVVKFLIDSKVDIHAKSAGSITALHLAAQNGHEEVVKVLLKAGVDINAKIVLGKTALRMAIDCGRLKVAEILMLSGALIEPCPDTDHAMSILIPIVKKALRKESKEPIEDKEAFGANKKKKKKKKTKTSGHEKIEAVSHSSSASNRGNSLRPETPEEKIVRLSKIIQQLEAENLVLETGMAKYLKGTTLAVLKESSQDAVITTGRNQIAKNNEKIDFCRKHIEVYKLEIRKKELESQELIATKKLKECVAPFKQLWETLTPLQKAVIVNDQHEVARILLGEGADVNEIIDQGLTPLHFAAAQDYPEIAKMLIAAGADIEAKDRDEGRTPLITAAQHGSFRVLNILILAGAKLEAESNKGATTFTIAGTVSEAVKLLTKTKADLERSGKGGLTALYMAAESNNVECMKALIKAGANINANPGYIPPAWWSGIERAHILQVLLEYGAKIENPKMIADVLGIADKKGDLIRNILLNKQTIAQALLAAKRFTRTDINFQDQSGMTAIMWCVLRNPEFISKIFDYCDESGCRADLTHTNLEGQTALSLAMNHYNKDVVEKIADYIRREKTIIRSYFDCHGLGLSAAKIVNDYLFDDYSHPCEVCKQPTKSSCLGCYQSFYCSLDCLKAHWKVHKPVCKKISTPSVHADKA